MTLQRHSGTFRADNSIKSFPTTNKRTFIGFPFVKVFIDDILIASKNNKEHLETVLKRLKTNNIFIEYKKSHFMQTQVTYLGHIISEKKTQADTSRVANVEAREPLKTKKQLKQLLG